MYVLEKAETLPLTKDIVMQHANMEPSPTERDLDPSRLNYLRQKAEAKTLVTFQWAVAKFNGRTVRINGQHSSTMLNQMNGSFPDGLQVHLDTYKVDDETDLAVLFRQFDARKSSRTGADVAGAYQGLYKNLAGVPKPVAKLAIEGIAYYLRYVEGVGSLSGDDQYAMFEQSRYHPFVQWMGDVHSVKTPEMKVIPVAAAMFATFETNAEQARIFWDQVSRGGVEFDDNAPSTVLDNWLKAAKNADKKRKLQLRPGNFYQACIYAWNAFREEKPLKDIKHRVDKGLLSAHH